MDRDYSVYTKTINADGGMLVSVKCVFIRTMDDEFEADTDPWRSIDARSGNKMYINVL